MLVGAALALFGLALGFALANNVDAAAEAKWWDLMTAFGTVGAVVVALLIPIRQRREALNDAKVARLRHEWFMTDEAVRLIRAVRGMLNNWASHQGKPLDARISTVISEMTNVRLSSDTPGLRYMLRNAIEVAGNIQEDVARTSGISATLDRLSGVHVQKEQDDELYLCLKIAEQAQTELLAEFDRLKLPRPV